MISGMGPHILKSYIILFDNIPCHSLFCARSNIHIQIGDHLYYTNRKAYFTANALNSLLLLLLIY